MTGFWGQARRRKRSGKPGSGFLPVLHGEQERLRVGSQIQAFTPGSVKAKSAETHRQVERLHMFGQGPDGDIVDPGLGKFADSVKGDVAGDLQRRGQR